MGALAHLLGSKATLRQSAGSCSRLHRAEHISRQRAGVRTRHGAKPKHGRHSVAPCVARRQADRAHSTDARPADFAGRQATHAARDRAVPGLVNGEKAGMSVDARRTESNWCHDRGCEERRGSKAQYGSSEPGAAA